MRRKRGKHSRPSEAGQYIRASWARPVTDRDTFHEFGLGSVFRVPPGTRVDLFHLISFIFRVTGEEKENTNPAKNEDKRGSKDASKWSMYNERTNEEKVDGSLSPSVPRDTGNKPEKEFEENNPRISFLRSLSQVNKYFYILESRQNPPSKSKY